MLSFSDYATQRGVSYECVRRQVDKHKDALEGHIMSQYRTRFLDDYAVAYLDEHRSSSSAAIVSSREEIQSKTERNEQLESENKELLRKIALLQDQLLNLQEENKAGIEARTQLKMLTATKESLENRDAELTAKVAVLEVKASRVEQLEEKQSALKQEKADWIREKARLEAEKNSLAEEKVRIQNELNKEKNSYVKSIFGLWKKKTL